MFVDVLVLCISELIVLGLLSLKFLFLLNLPLSILLNLPLSRLFAYYSPLLLVLFVENCDVNRKKAHGKERVRELDQEQDNER